MEGHDRQRYKAWHRMMMMMMMMMMSEYEAQMNAFKQLWVNLILGLDLDLFFHFI